MSSSKLLCGGVGGGGLDVRRPLAMINVVGRIAKIPQLSFVLQLSSVSLSLSPSVSVSLSLSVCKCMYKCVNVSPQTKDKTSL